MLFTRLYIIIFFLVFFGCKNTNWKHGDKNTQLLFHNTYDNVESVGMHKCAACHVDQYENYIQTGMGKSLTSASKINSSSLFQELLHDTINAFTYHPYWIRDSLYVDEYQLSNNDTSHYLTYHINYIIGSGHHTNSHLYLENGYLYQAPVTYYTQDSVLDFPPGFENNENSRFSRKMGLECVACHTAYPSFVLGSENKYTVIPEGIDCERCHGPGDLHVNKIKDGNITDTTSYIDYTIVNPAHLSIELQNDLCARCHLQGNAVLQENKSFLDFRPGMHLKEIMDVYLPRYANSENEFIMASHVDRMKLSKCYIESDKQLSCVTCHNPHVSVKKVTNDIFNNKCKSCHSIDQCDNKFQNSKLSQDNCVSCHMRSSETIDIPHVKITDHRIGIYDDTINILNYSNDNLFLGLECINNDNPKKSSILQAYLQQYERFENKTYYLDSAYVYLNQINVDDKPGFYSYVYYLFLKKDYDLIIDKVYSLGVDSVLKYYLFQKDYSNKDAWTSYRIGEAFMKKKYYNDAFVFYQKAVKLAPYNLEFRNKYAVVLFNQNKVEFAIDEFNFIINQDGNFTSAYSNLGYVYATLGDKSKALAHYNYALNLNPHHEATLINKALLLLLENKLKDAFICIDKVLNINPYNQDALRLLKEYNEI